MAYFGEGKGPIHVDNVKCTGNERSLADCIKQDIGKHNCRHSEDAGVICDYLNKKTDVGIKGCLAWVCPAPQFQLEKNSAAALAWTEGMNKGCWHSQAGLSLPK
ncbi:neurotrypsin isoform X2, partial [Pelobates cultripes]